VFVILMIGGVVNSNHKHISKGS